MPRSPRLQEQWALLDRQEYHRAFDGTFALRRQLRGADLHDAYKLLGLACHRQRQYRRATLWFRKACQGSDDAADWYELAASATMQGNVELGAEAFEQVRICQQAAKYRQEPSFHQQLYWYACTLCDTRQYVALQPLLDELAAVYRRLCSTDTPFLYVRRVPFLSCFLGLVTRHFRKQERYEEGEAWMQALSEALDEGGQRQVRGAIGELERARAEAQGAEFNGESGRRKAQDAVREA